jgi:hypothetical protein
MEDLKDFSLRLDALRQVSLSELAILNTSDTKRRDSWDRYVEFITKRGNLSDRRGKVITIGKNPSNTIDLAMALRYSKLFEVTDPRDYIYGVLGITNTALLTDENHPGQ